MGPSPYGHADVADLDAQVSAGDRALVAEAMRRIEAARPGGAGDRAAILSAIVAALREGRRDLFGLVKAGSRAL